MKCTRLILFFCVLTLAIHLSAQEESGFDNWEVSVLELPGGNSGNSVQKVFHDQQGYLWFASQEGLHRYDGNNFTTFKPEPGNPESISSPYVEDIVQDSKGYLWFATFGKGLNRYDPQTERFKHYRRDNTNPLSLSSDSILCITLAPDGTLWLGTPNGLDQFDPESGKRKHFQHDPNDPNSLSFNIVQDVLFDSQGVMWVACSWIWAEETAGKGGLHRYVPEKDHFVRYQHDPNDASSLTNSDIWDIFEDSKGNFWVATDKTGLHLMDREKETFTYFPRIDSFETQLSDIPRGPSLLDQRDVNFPGLRRIFEDQEGRLWFASFFEGMTVWNPETKQLSVINKYSSYYNNPPHNSFWDVFQTKDGNIWISGGGEGRAVLRLSLSKNEIRTIALPVSASTHIQTINSNKADQLWLGTSDEGAFHYDLESEKIEHYDGNNEEDGFLNDPDVHDITFDPEGNVWFAGWHGEGGLTRLNPNTKQTKIFTADATQVNDLGGNEIPALYTSKGGDIWIGTIESGISKYLPNTESFQHYQIKDSLGQESKMFFFGAFEDRQENLWFGGIQDIPGSSDKASLSIYDPKGDSLRSIWTEDSLFNYQATFPPHDFHEDHAGNIWFLLREYLIKYKPTTGEMLYYQGAEPELLNWLIPSREGAWYISTDYEIHKFWPEENRMVTLPILLDMEGFHFDQCVHQVDKYQWWIGFGQQIYLFDTRAWDGYQGANSTEVQLGTLTTKDRLIPIGSKLLPTSLNTRSELTFYKEHFPIRIQVLATQFDFSEESTIRYRLDPFDNDWRVHNSGNDIYIPEILNGTYTLRLQARGPFSDWGPEKVLTIIVPKAWWQQWWAFLLYALTIGTFIYLVVRWRTLKQKLKLAQQEEALQREREINERLQHIDRLKDQFLANTSHELRTPLNGIIGLSEALIEDEANLEKRENLSMIISSGKRLSSLVNDILDFSKLNNHEIILRQKAVDLRSLSKLVLRIHQPLVNHKEVSLINDIPDNLPLLWADEDRLQQILFNLVGNATKFTESGEIRIRAAVQNEQVQISVSDTGIGIPEVKQASIFQAFEQGDGSVQRAFAGTGLGLTISQQLVELHGGKIWLESTVDQGSTFYFSLPIASANAIAQVKQASSAQPLTPLTIPIVAATATVEIKPILNADQLRILVVDDEPINQQVLKNHLSSQKYQLSQAMNGEEALSLLDQGPAYDLVLLDVMMPRMSGYEVCQKIRERFLPSELPVIMVTAKNQIADLVEGLDTGANDYLAKPFSKDELLARLKTHLNLHRINKVTNRFVPTAFIRSLGKADLTELRLGDLSKQVVTVFFSDIRDYTGLAERMSPEDTFRFVNAYAGRMGPIIHGHHGFVNQYLGDGIMAIFQQSPDDALGAAIAMQQKLQVYNQERMARDRRPIAVGMGMHTGSLVMGIIGDETRTDAATIADTVNTASRMEGLTKNFGTHMLLSEESVKGLQSPEKYQLRFLGKVRVKGKQEPQGVYECYDMDPPAQQDLKRSQVKAFAEALDLYGKGSFSQAIVALEQLMKANPEDKVVQYFYQQARHYLIQGVPADWQGEV